MPNAARVLDPLVSEFDTQEEAEAYDRWFRAKIESRLRRADDPATKWVPHEQVMARTRAIIAKYERDAEQA